MTVAQRVFMFNESKEALHYFIELYKDSLVKFLNERGLTIQDIQVESGYVLTPRAAYHSFYCCVEQKSISFLYLPCIRIPIGAIDQCGNITYRII